MDKPASKPEAKPESPLTYVVYDKSSGRIIHTHSHFNVETGKYEERDPKEVLDLVRDDEFAMSKVTGHDAANLAVMPTRELPEGAVSLRTGAMVDLKSKKVVARPRLRLRAGKTQLSGDGHDSTTIQMDVIDAGGKVVKDYAGAIKITTTRGKLSARGGLIEMKGGKGEITITSANETVDRVQVSAYAVDGSVAKADLEIEFL